MRKARILGKRMESAERLAFITLTLNPANGTPRELFDYVTDNRLIGRLMRFLREHGYITNWGYFSALEFQNGQKNKDRKYAKGPPTYNAHWHIIVEPVQGLDAARGGDLHEIVERWWNGHAPRGASDRVSHTYKMGKCDSEDVSSDHDREKIAWYVATYLAQGSLKGGIPKWFLDRADEGHHVRLHSVSHGFWTGGVVIRDREAAEKAKEQGEEVEKPKRRRRCVADRLAHCCEETTAMVKVTEFDELTGEVIGTRRDYVGSCKWSVETCQVMIHGFDDAATSKALVAGKVEASLEAFQELVNRGYLSADRERLRRMGVVQSKAVWVNPEDIEAARLAEEKEKNREQFQHQQWCEELYQSIWPKRIASAHFGRDRIGPDMSPAETHTRIERLLRGVERMCNDQDAKRRKRKATRDMRDYLNGVVYNPWE